MADKYPKLWIGTSGWAYDDWAGLFYPEDCPKNSWLQYYARQFNTVELNASFPGSTYPHWYGAVSKGFRDVVKLSQYITHILKTIRFSVF